MVKFKGHMTKEDFINNMEDLYKDLNYNEKKLFLILI